MAPVVRALPDQYIICWMVTGVSVTGMCCRCATNTTRLARQATHHDILTEVVMAGWLSSRPLTRQRMSC